MKLAFVTHPVTSDTCTVSIVKAISQHDPVAVVLTWNRNGKMWSPAGWAVTCDKQAFIKAAGNLLHYVDKFFSENKLWGQGPEHLMLAMEKAEFSQVVIHGGEQMSTEELAKVKDQYAPVGTDDIVVNADDEADAKSTIRGRMMKLLKEDETRAEEVGKWFAAKQPIKKIEAAERPAVVHQKEYRVR